MRIQDEQKGGGPSTPRGGLETAEANALAAAMVADLAQSRGIRTLTIKGVSLTAHGIRHGHNSADVDILVEPDRHLDLVKEVESLGWMPRPTTAADRRLVTFSVTLSSASWPNDLDIHSSFPGVLNTPSLAFEVLWARRTVAKVAGIAIWIPDLASSVVVWTLHSLRGSQSQERHAEELRQIRDVVLPNLSEAELKELADRIVELGADEPLRVVPEFAEIIGDRHGPQAPGALKAWRAKLAQAHEASPWLQVLRDARASERPWLLFRAVWPSAHDLRLMDEALVDSTLGRAQSRWRRARRLARRVVGRRRQAH